MAYKPSKACYDAASAAAGGKLGRDDINAAFERVGEFRDKMQADGTVDGMDERLRSRVEQEAERTAIAAALRKKQAALNVLVRDRLDTTIKALRDQGLSPRKAVLAVLEGTQHGIKGGRVSVAATRLAFEGRYIGDMFAQIAKDRPHLLDIITDKHLNDDVAREMAELKDGGRPGITGNKDAEYLAKTFATYAEMSRVDLNKRGASIGKLDGWSGSQVHDDLKLIAAGKDEWITRTLPKLNIARTFTDAKTVEDVTDAMSSVYDTLITGIDNKAPSEPAGGRVNPANLAKQLGKSRVLHFKGADEALAYQAEFGFGNTVSGIIAHQKRAARIAAAMDVLGPNPENMMRGTIERLQKSIRNDDRLSDKQKRAFAAEAQYDKVASAMDIATGLAARPVNASSAKWGTEIRAVIGMAKLGAAVITAMPTDTVTAAAAAMFRGDGFLAGALGHIGLVMKGRPKGEQREIAYLLGEGFEGITGHIMSQHADANDMAAGRMSRLAETFYRFNRLTWWDEVARSAAARMASAGMGSRLRTAFADLDLRFRHVMEINGIHEPQWRAIQQGDFRQANGNSYVTGDAMRSLPDEAVAHLGADADKARFDLEMAIRRYVADETRYGVVQTDAQSRRLTTFGTRPGTFVGEAIRYITQFKGFPIAFTTRVLGRAAFGGAGATKGARFTGNLAHLGTLIAGLTVAGYMSNVMKQMIAGKTPQVPRNPAEAVDTMLSSLVQSGAAGVYGDFLFGHLNRFGNTALETAAGPLAGTAANLVNLYQAFRGKLSDEAGGKTGGKYPLGQALNLAVQSTPFANLFYARPALDVLFLNALREAASPGYLKRQEQTMQRDTGQRYVIPRTLTDVRRAIQ